MLGANFTTTVYFASRMLVHVKLQTQPLLILPPKPPRWQIRNTPVIHGIILGLEGFLTFSDLDVRLTED